MSRANLYMVVVFVTGVVLAGCGATEVPARAEAAPLPVAAPAPVVAAATPEPPPASVPPAETQKTEPPAPRGLDQLKAQLQEIASEQVEPAPATTTTATPAAESDASDELDETESLRNEVKDLRREVARLQETVDAALAYLVGELGDENRRLKKDIATEEELADDTQQTAPALPIPPAHPAAPVVNYGALGYLSIKEWGRTPEQAKEMAGDVSSLRGMICAVHPGATDDELKGIGKKLRDACAGYDNINIEVFDDEAAARDYAERNVRSSAHFVMKITRHKTSGQDVTVLVRDNGAREIVVGDGER
jgi:hypothetical protein